jgi:hypothetical protein
MRYTKRFKNTGRTPDQVPADDPVNARFNLPY